MSLEAGLLLADDDQCARELVRPHPLHRPRLVDRTEHPEEPVPVLGEHRAEHGIALVVRKLAELVQEEPEIER
mgnify:CR=1 FL=1